MKPLKKRVHIILRETKSLAEDAWEHRISVLMVLAVIAIFAYSIDWVSWLPYLMVLGSIAFFFALWIVLTIIGAPIILLINWIQKKFLNK